MEASIEFKIKTYIFKLLSTKISDSRHGRIKWDIFSSLSFIEEPKELCNTKNGFKHPSSDFLYY